MKRLLILACLILASCGTVTALSTEQTEAKLVADYNAAQTSLNALPASDKHSQAQTALNAVLAALHKADAARIALDIAGQAAALTAAQTALATATTDISATKGN